MRSQDPNNTPVICNLQSGRNSLTLFRNDKVVLLLRQTPAVKKCGGVEAERHAFLLPTFDGGEWVS